MKETRLKNTWLTILLVAFIGIFPSVSLAYTSTDCFSASGFGDSGVNGTYVFANNYNGEPSFTNGNDYIVNWGTGGYSNVYYAIGSTQNTQPTNLKYYQDSGGNPANHLITGTWNNAGWAGTAPAGNIATTTCPSSPPLTQSENNFIGLPLLNFTGTSTQNTSTGVTQWTGTYTANTTTQDLINAITDKTQNNLYAGILIFILSAGGILWILKQHS